MIEVTLQITDSRHIEAVDAARVARNAMLPVDAGTWPADPNGSCADEESYIRFVAVQAAESWAVQHVDK